jgi:DNA excision repair protein ERCC-4
MDAARARVRIICDSREGFSGIPGALQELGATVEIRALAVGDYDLGGGSLVERKRIRDLYLTLVYGRLWDQLGKLRRSSAIPYVLVEGLPLQGPPVQVERMRGALLAVIELGVPVLPSEDPMDSARWLFRLALRRQGPAPRNRPVYAQRRKSAAIPAGEALLGAIPTVSSSSARALLQRFGTVSAIAQGTPDEWCAVHGIGEVRARALDQAFNSQHPLYRSRRSRE